MSDLSELNKQLSSLTQDFEKHQQWQEVRQKQINDETYNKMNNKWQEYQTFNTTQNTPYPQLQQPSHNPKLSNQYQQHTPQHTQQHTPQQIPQTHQPQSQFTRMDNYQVLHQPDNQSHQYHQQEQQQQQQQQDLRQDMNSRMDRFRFDSESNMKHTLVPVDMNHYYSGNLFMEGTPVPNGLPENVEQYSNNNTGLKNQSRLLHQEKSKTLYRNDVNQRMAQFSPLGRTLHFPVNHHSNNDNSNSPNANGNAYSNNNNMFPQNMLTKTSRKNEMKADINARLSGYSPLSSNTPLHEDSNNYSRHEIAPYPTHSNETNSNVNHHHNKHNQINNNQNSNQNNPNQHNNINRQQKIKFQEMMPVSST